MCPFRSLFINVTTLWLTLLEAARSLRGKTLVRAMMAVVLVTAYFSAPANADTLKSALASAYINNPELEAERARLRASDEDIQRARSGWAPSLKGEANIGRANVRTTGQPRDVTRSGDLGVQLTQPLFTGFRTYNAVNEAEAGVRAARAQLRDVEGRLLRDVAHAYFDVVRDRELVLLAQRIVSIFTRELAAAKGRLRVGEVTVTDVDQAQSRRARAVVALQQFKGDLRGSEASFQRYVGRPPRHLATKLITLGLLPSQLSAAVAIARQENALVEHALYREQAARFAVSKERSELLPRFDLEAGYRRGYSDNGETTRSDTAEVVGRLLVPLYEGGGVRARIRQVKHLHVSTLQEVEQARRIAANEMRLAWALLTAAQAKIAADRIRIKYVQSALKGVRKEERVGQRTVLDVLNAEEEVFQAQSSLTQNERDYRIARYDALYAIGRLDAQSLSLTSEQYDPVQHYTEAKQKWLTTAIAAPHDTAEKEVHAAAQWRSSVRPASRLGGPPAVAKKPTGWPSDGR